MKKYLLLSLVMFFALSFGIVFAGNVRLGNKSAYIPDGFLLVNSSSEMDTYMNSETFEGLNLAVKSLGVDSSLDLDMSSDFVTNLMTQELAKSNMTVINSEKLNLNGKKIALLRCKSGQFGDVLVAYYADQGYIYMVMYMQMDMNTQTSVVDYNKGRGVIISIINSIR